MIFAVIGLSSANKQVTALSCGSGALFKSIEATDEGGVLCASHFPVSWDAVADQESDCEPSPLVEIEAVRNRLGMELRRWMSPSRWLLSLKRSTAPKSDGLRAWLLALPGVGGPLDGDDAMDDVEVAGEGGPVGDPFAGGSMVVMTLDGFLARLEILFRRA